MEALLQIRELGMKLRENRRKETVDFEFLTAPCGLPCFDCYLYLAQFDTKMAQLIADVHGLSKEEITCRGCRPENGRCAHLAMDCRVFHCIEKTDMKTCAECDEFPCEYLHPYSDQAMKPHNTKVFNLCRIKKLGIHTWASQEAGKILDTYYYGTWTL